MSDIYEDEWRAEIGRLRQCDDGLTATEIAKASGVSGRTTRKMIRKGLEEGRYVEGRAFRKNARGRMVRVPVYRIVKKGKK